MILWAVKRGDAAQDVNVATKITLLICHCSNTANITSSRDNHLGANIIIHFTLFTVKPCITGNTGKWAGQVKNITLGTSDRAQSRTNICHSSSTPNPLNSTPLANSQLECLTDSHADRSDLPTSYLHSVGLPLYLHLSTVPPSRDRRANHAPIRQIDASAASTFDI